MYTYTGQGTLFTTLTNNTSSTNLAFGQQFINQYTLELVHRFPSIFSEDTFTLQTYPNQQYYTLPQRLRKINTVVINVGNTGAGVPTTVTGAGFNWPVKECPTTYDWNVLNMTNNITSDIPLAYLFYNNQLGIYPKPAAGYNPITIRGQVEVASISQADDVATTITAVPAMPNGCTDYSQSEVSTDLDGVLKNPINLENLTHANAEGGADIRTSLLATKGMGGRLLIYLQQNELRK